MLIAPDYQPISDYAAIGNTRTVALIGLDGSIDWCCLPQLDAPSVFATILDRRRGGRFRIAPAHGSTSTQRYLPETNVLETTFETAGGRLVVTDWMPLSGRIDGCGGSTAPPSVHRQVRCEGDAVDVELWWAPRFDYARSRTSITRTRGGFVARGAGGERLVLTETFANAMIVDDGDGPCVWARFSLSAEQSRWIATIWDAEDAAFDPRRGSDTLRETVDVWRRWVDPRPRPALHDQLDRGLDRDLLVRSELALKLLTHGETGAIAAAATTSLPESIGGVRNWDYRFAWIRDASQIIESYTALGHHAEVRAFFRFIERVCKSPDSGQSVGIMYGLDGATDVPEQILGHLEGHRQSAPVRIGNDAFGQVQHDVNGEILNSAYEMARRGERLSPGLQRLLQVVADDACRVWRRPDHGIWEIRRKPRHYVYSKMMAWVALDRAVQMARRHGLAGNWQRWQSERDELHADILRHGWSPEVGAFTMAYDSQDLDAANLMFPMMEFLPFDDPRVQSTIDRTLEQLTDDGVVHRYRCDDGLPGREGAFGLTTFWMIDALAFSGRLDEAHQMYEGVAKRANHVGLYAEQFHADPGVALGNFPQAFSHIGLIDSTIHLAWLEGLDTTMDPPMGSIEHRAELGRT
jgi:GH15 family glucan-1,4-alpha-glucosidase